MTDRAHKEILNGLQAAADACAEIHSDLQLSTAAEREATAALLRAVASKVIPALDAICDLRADVHEPGTVHGRAALLELGALRRGGRLYLCAPCGEPLFARVANDGARYLRVSAGEISREVDLPSVVRRVAERMRASITGAAVQRTKTAQSTAEKLFALEVLLRE